MYNTVRFFRNPYCKKRVVTPLVHRHVVDMYMKILCMCRQISSSSGFEGATDYWYP